MKNWLRPILTIVFDIEKMNFQGQYPGARGGFDAYGVVAAESRMNEMARIAELNRLQQLSQMNHMQMSRLHELTRLTREVEVSHGIYVPQEALYAADSYDDAREHHFEADVGGGDYSNFEGSSYRDRESSDMDNSMETDSYSRSRDRDRDQRDGRSRDRGRDRERRRDSDRDRRGSDYSQERSDRSSRHHSRERSSHRDRSPVDSHRSDYDMEDEHDRDRRGRNRDGRSDDKYAECNQPSRKIIIRNLHTTVDEKMINDELVKSGLPIKDIRLIRRASGVSRCFAFVEFHNLSDAQRWMEQTQGTLFIQNQFRASLAYSIQRDRGGNRDNNSMQRWDWVCSKCLGHNFKRRDYCFNCNLPRKESEKGKPSDGQEEVGNNPCNTLIFRGLDALTTEEGLISALNPVCAPIAPVKNVAIIRDEMNTSRGFGFMEFPTVQASTQVLDALTQMVDPLEVDGKQLLVNYAKNTFNTTMAYIQQQQAAQTQHYDQNSGYYNQQGQYYDSASQQYYNYSDYYNQTGNTPVSKSASTTTKTTGENSTNNAAAVAHAAIQQAQAAKNLQKQVYKKTVGGNDYVNVNGIDYPIYPAPDTSQYQYEETSGYYFDPTTQLYYDANSQYYYNSTTGQFMYWDAEKSTYLPAPTSPENSATSPEQGSDKKDGSVKKDKEKSKMAKKIAKDMEKWAKSMNAQKEAQKDVFKRPIGPPVALPPGKLESATADAGFAILTKAKDDKTAMAPPPTMSDSSASDQKPGLVASYGGDSDSGDEDDSSAPVDESKLVDWTKLACLLCKRQFQSKEILSKHTQVSDLHKKNLESLIKSREEASASKIEYRDRAKERRKKYGAPGPPEPHRRSDRGDGVDVPPPIVPEEPTKFGIGGDNIGNRLLQKMGWSHGQGLGKDNQGRTIPVEAKRRNQAAGLGARGSKVVADVGDNYRDALKKTMFARYSELD